MARYGNGGCFWMRIETQWRRPGTNGWAALRYPGGCTSLEPPSSNNSLALLAPATALWISGDLQPLHSSQSSEMPSDNRVVRRQTIDGQQTRPAHRSKAVVWQDSGVVYNETGTLPTMPYLLQLYSGSREAPSMFRALGNQSTVGWDERTRTFVAARDEVVDVLITNRPSSISSQVELHPWHFHHKSWHVASGTGNFSEAALAAIRSKGLYAKPILRDTFTVWPVPGSTLDPQDVLPAGGMGGWTLIRFQVQSGDAGVWPLHCHLHFHMAMGMSSTFALDTDSFDQRYRFRGDPNYFVFGRNVMSPYTYHRQQLGRW